ncbi:hypothetical protein GOP47_0004837 [Adiantum capillus-veneris]|uniref:CASP-like protein n=1 Tax=Adiantum capillus-veneris TaxID=13818 RepID=A0A9D4ZKU0_ADICA|nr:hypothetical protein GOP47_0004837 [Adiantum capillus-veneris]
MGKDKQDTFVLITNIPVPIRARHSYIEAFVFLVYANGIVAIYSLIALLLCFLARRRLIAGLLFVMDQALAYLLLAAAAASTEASYIAKRGESKTVVALFAVAVFLREFCLCGLVSKGLDEGFFGFRIKALKLAPLASELRMVAIFTQIYTTFIAPKEAACLFIVAVGPTLVALFVMFIVRPIKEKSGDSTRSESIGVTFIYAVGAYTPV